VKVPVRRWPRAWAEVVCVSMVYVDFLHDCM
jgi:hypothetical protein